MIIYTWREIMKIYYALVLTILFSGTAYGADINEELDYFEQIFPFVSYKKVIDTCMRAYSDLLVLEEKHSEYEIRDDHIDLLVGRIMRLRSYIKQLIYERHHEATVTEEDLMYVHKVLEYMEITATHLSADSVPVKLNRLLIMLKKMVSDDLE